VPPGEPVPPSGPGATDTDPPETTIDRAPKRKSHRRKAKFSFSASEPGASFECLIDRAAFAPCAESITVRIKAGKHRLSVRAVDAAGNADPTPALATWKVKRRRRSG
jgi:hypothetical protein